MIIFIQQGCIKLIKKNDKEGMVVYIFLKACCCYSGHNIKVVFSHFCANR